MSKMLARKMIRSRYLNLLFTMWEGLDYVIYKIQGNNYMSFLKRL